MLELPITETDEFSCLLPFLSFPFLPKAILTSSRFRTCSHEAAGLLDKLFAFIIIIITVSYLETAQTGW